jgi:hypothetical protein
MITEGPQFRIEPIDLALSQKATKWNAVWKSLGILREPKLRRLSPQANYTARATAAVGEVVRLLRIEGCCVVSATGPHGR